MSKFFKGVEPHCEYCSNGTLSADKKNVLCKKKGVVSLGYSCLSYKYDPLLRIPKRQAKLSDYNPEDFAL